MNTQVKMAPENLAVMLSHAMLAATESLDLSKIEAVHVIIEKEGAGGMEGLLRMISERVGEFLLSAAPGFEKELKRATGRSRDQWLDLLQ